MKQALVILTLIASLAGGCVATVSPGAAPPPPRVERLGIAPSPAHVWVSGHWAWRRGGWSWVDGHWARRPLAGVAWVAGHWTERQGRWVWIEGRWR